MKLYSIIYSTNEGIGSFAIKDKEGNNMWVSERAAIAVLQEIYQEEIENSGETVFDSNLWAAFARIVYEDDSWAEYRIIQTTVPSDFPIYHFTAEINVKEYIIDEHNLNEKEASLIRGFIDHAYCDKKHNYDISSFINVVNRKLGEGESIEEICSQSTRDFLKEVEWED